MARWKIAGISFEHFHMGDNLRMVAEHPDAEIVGVCDPQPARMREAASDLSISEERVFTEWEACLEKTRPDVVVLCPSAADHGLWTKRMMGFGVDVIIEKPMAASLSEADAMIAEAEKAKRRLAINWPSNWAPVHQTTYRLIREGTIGDVLEVHYYGGNRGPLYHGAGKRETTPEEIAAQKPTSWFYSKQAGGGSLLDYMGYGTTLGTWFNGGQVPLEVTATVDEPPGLEVDEHAIAVARYAKGLSKFETRWGTFTDPWTHQPQPRCGFVVVGSEGTIGSFDYASSVRLQTRETLQGTDVPCDTPPLEQSNPIRYFLHCLENDQPIEGPSSTTISRIGQQIVDTAIRSVETKSTQPLLGTS